MTIEKLARALYEPLDANTLPSPNRKGRESKNKLNPTPINNPLAFAN